MSMRTFCAQLFIFAIVAVALLALPQAARAHPGHAHTMHVHVHPDTHTADVSAPADHAVDQQTEPSLASAAQDTPGNSTDAPCDRSCCAQASCAACFSMVAPMPPLVAPPSLSTVIGLTANPVPHGIGGPSLKRPPRSFA